MWDVPPRQLGCGSLGGVRLQSARPLPQLAFASDLGGKRDQLLLVEVGDEGIAEIGATPEQDVKSTICAESSLDAANVARRCGKRQAVGAEHEKRDRVQAALEFEGG